MAGLSFGASLLGLIGAALAYRILFYRRHIHVPEMLSNNKLMRSLDIRAVYPHFLFPEGFLQSFCQLFRTIRITDRSIRSEMRVPIGGGVTIHLIVYEPAHGTDSHSSHNAAVENVLLVHGLNGSAESTYIRGMANVFLSRGCRVFCYNARGAMCSSKSDVFSHHGLTSDVRATAEHILARCPGRISMIGFSLGSNWVAKLMGEWSDERVRMGAAVCCPFDFTFLRAHYREGLGRGTRMVNYLMTNNYKRNLRRSLLAPPDLSGCRYLDEIDSNFLGIFGKGSLDEFYVESSCVNYVGRIDKPFLFINSVDDPVIPITVVPVDACLANENIGFIRMRGGHLGFLTNRSMTSVEEIMGRFYDRLMEADGK